VSVPDLLAAAAGKAGLLWVLPDADAGRVHARPLWHVWHADAVHVVVGGGEQPDPFEGVEVATVRVPSKDTGAALVDVAVRPVDLTPGTDEWDAAAAALKASRLNAPEAGAPLIRWAAGSRVLRLEPAADAARVTSRRPGAVVVDIEGVRPRGWRPMRSRLRRGTFGRRR
jgi:hypothetical protein